MARTVVQYIPVAREIPKTWALEGVPHTLPQVSGIVPAVLPPWFNTFLEPSATFF